MSEKEMRERFEVWFGERYGALDASGAAMRANMWTAFQAGAQSAPRVPREPTVHMLDAAINNDDGPCTIAFAKTIWRAMYDAAPPEARNGSTPLLTQQ